MADWFSVAGSGAIERLLLAWPGAPEDQDELLEMILDVAKEQVTAFAPATAFDITGLIPAPRLVLAQLMQAQNLWNAGTANFDGQIGPEGYSFVPRPMDKTIRSIIRPQSGVPDVL